MSPERVAARLDVMAEEFHELRNVPIEGTGATNWFAWAEGLAFAAWFFRRYNGRTLNAPGMKAALELYLTEHKPRLTPPPTP